MPLTTSTDSETKCHRVCVPREACILLFGVERITHSERLGTSMRGEEMWAHCDAEGRIIEIELLGTDKPCQQDAGDGTVLRRVSESALSTKTRNYALRLPRLRHA